MRDADQCAGALAKEPRVLVLDEPGNDLDTDMLAVMEDLLDTWPGTLLLVSHDRYLMERVTDDQFALLDGRLRHVPGGVDEYLDLLKDAKSKAGIETSEKSLTSTEGCSSQPTFDNVEKLSSRLTNSERRELKKRFDAVSRRLDKLSGEPERLRMELEETDATDYEALLAKQAQIDAAVELIADLETEWLELSERLGE